MRVISQKAMVAMEAAAQWSWHQKPVKGLASAAGQSVKGGGCATVRGRICNWISFKHYTNFWNEHSTQKHLPWENGYNLSTLDRVCWPGCVDRGGDGHIFKLQSQAAEEPWNAPPLTKTNLSKWWKKSYGMRRPLWQRLEDLSPPCETNIIFSAREMNKLLLHFILHASSF